LKRWFFLVFFLTATMGLSFSAVAAQDKTTNRQRAALTTVLEAGSQAVTVGDLLETEDFSGSNNWESYSDKDYSADTVDGVYRMNSVGNFYIWSVSTGDEHSDAVIEVETLQQSQHLTNEYGIICRADRDGGGYYFFISGDGYYAIRKGTADGLETLVDWAQSDVINQGPADNQIAAVCAGEYLALYANGELLAETTDDSLTSGLAGLAVGAFEDGDVEVDFDNVRIWDASLGESSAAQLDPALLSGAASLTQYGGKSEDTIAELESLGLIGAGSNFIFGEDYAFFTGQGSWFTPLASDQPRTNIVMGGDLTFQVGDANELETCTLSSRIETDSKGSAVTYLDVGLINDGSVFIFDQFSESSDANLNISTQTVDLNDSHNFVLVLIDDKANLYVDGQLMIQDFEVVKRAGTYGISLLGKGADAKCEGRNIWAYQIPASTTGDCTVSSSKTVNKRGGPGTNFDSAGQLESGTDAVVSGQAKGSDGLTWWQLDDGAWVREDVVTEVGDCVSVPVVQA